MTRFAVILLLCTLTLSGVTRDCFAINPAFELHPSQILSNPPEANTRKQEAARSDRQQFKKRVVRRSAVRRSKSVNGRSPSLYLSAQQQIADSTSIDQRKISAFWEQLVPTVKNDEYRPFESRTSAFDLALDPDKYPQLKAKNGKLLLLDRENSLPPLIKALIQEQNKNVSVISGTPGNDHEFFKNLLAAGEFFSVAENATISFGSNPRLKVFSDFKVERNAESVLKNEVVLVNAASQKFPELIKQHLNSQGVTLLEPLGGASTEITISHNSIVVARKGQVGVKSLPAVLNELVNDVVPNKRIELFQAADTGIKLSVTAGYYFEYNNKKYVVSAYSADPVAFTLYRLLETKGYQVILVDEKDDFKQMTSKLLKHMGLQREYTQQRILVDPNGKYEIELSGFVIEGSRPGGGAVVLTDIRPDDSMLAILKQHGYQIKEAGSDVK